MALRACATAALLVGLIASGGCATSQSSPSSSTGARSTLPATPRLPMLSACPTSSTPGASFPQGLSSRLPHPTAAQSAHYVPTHVHGVKLLEFTTQMSLRDAVIFVLKQYPSNGWALGRGDSEQHEADVPFAQGAVHGTTRLTGLAACTTRWLVATVVNYGNGNLGNVPQLAPHTATSSALPFATLSPSSSP